MLMGEGAGAKAKNGQEVSPHRAEGETSRIFNEVIPGSSSPPEAGNGGGGRLMESRMNVGISIRLSIYSCTHR